MLRAGQLPAPDPKGAAELFDQAAKDYQHAAFMYGLVVVIIGAAVLVDLSKETKKGRR